MRCTWCFGPRCVPKPQCRRVGAVDRDDAFQAAADGWDKLDSREVQPGELVAARDANLAALDDAAKSLTRLLADLGSFRNRQTFAFRGFQNRSGKGMTGVALEACDHSENLRSFPTRHCEKLGQGGLAVGESASLVEDRGAALRDLLQHGGALDDDRPTRAERDRPDDGDGNGEEERAGRGDDQHGQKPGRVAGKSPRGQRDDERDGSVERAEAVAEAL